MTNINKHCAYRFSCLLAIFALPALLQAATPIGSLSYSTDISVIAGSTLIDDEAVLNDNLSGARSPVNIGSLPENTAIDAYHHLGGGSHLVSFDTSITLGSTTYEPADIVRFNGSTYSIEFDASTKNIPPGVNVDALTMDNGNLLLSFDQAITLSGTTFDDEDLVRLVGSSYSMAVNTGNTGVPEELDLDAAHLLANGHYLFSFDGSGSVGGFSFDDEDVLEYNPSNGAWDLAWDADNTYAAFHYADTDAIFATAPDSDEDGVPDSTDNCPLNANPTQLDTDGDGEGNACDLDDDNDGVLDTSDIDELNFLVCADADADQCDDCAEGVDGFGPQPDNNPNNDGLDTDADGACNVGDLDDDNDGVLDTMDLDSLDPFSCSDTDTDLCDDCSIGIDGFGPLADILPANDGPDYNADGICDLSDPPITADGDLNDDGVVNAADVQLAIRMLLGQIPSDLARGDVAPLVGGVPASDGLFDLGDVLLIQRKALGQIYF